MKILTYVLNSQNLWAKKENFTNFNSFKISRNYNKLKGK